MTICGQQIVWCPANLSSIVTKMFLRLFLSWQVAAHPKAEIHTFLLTFAIIFKFAGKDLVILQENLSPLIFKFGHASSNKMAADSSYGFQIQIKQCFFQKEIPLPLTWDELLLVRVDNSDLDGPTVWLCIRLLHLEGESGLRNTDDITNQSLHWFWSGHTIPDPLYWIIQYFPL